MDNVILPDNNFASVDDVDTLARFRHPLTIEVEGNARILGFGNGNPDFMEVERPEDPQARSFGFRTFNGLAQILLKSSDGNFTMSIE